MVVPRIRVSRETFLLPRHVYLKYNYFGIEKKFSLFIFTFFKVNVLFMLKNLAFMHSYTDFETIFRLYIQNIIESSSDFDQSYNQIWL